MGQNLSMPLSDQSSYGDKNREWNRRILGLPDGAGISLKAASGKEQEMVSGSARFVYSWDHSLHVSLLTRFFSVVHLSMPTLVGLFCYVEV